MAEAILEIKHVLKRFKGLVAVRAFHQEIQAGTIHSLIGPNGAGKTTLFNVISGIYTPEEGAIWFYGEEITGEKPHNLVAKGIARTFQNLRLFNQMSVLDNARVGRTGASRQNRAQGRANNRGRDQARA